VGGLGGLTGAHGVEGPGQPGLAAAERELRVPERRWARRVPAVAEPPFRYREMAGGRQP
jgi:hypothetical protein